MNVFVKPALQGAILCATLCVIATAAAHHSYAMFDRDKDITYSGVVRTWEFTNPHSYLWVYINNAEGKPELWSIENFGPSELLRRGWDKSTVKPGDSVTVTLNPLRDGGHGGNLRKLVLADGRVLDVGALPGAKPVAAPAATNQPSTKSGN